jgi:malate dehydrogenase (oxaloacetate-decarboxylating)
MKRHATTGPYAVDTKLVVRLRQHPNQLATLTRAIADQDALVTSISTVHTEEDEAVQEIMLQTHDETHTSRVLDAVRLVPGAAIESSTDSVFECHRGGKIGQKSRVRLQSLSDLRHIYTPGVARVCTAIQQRPERAWELTSIGNSIGIFTNGSRVLGLGNIGPIASMPVMEGKAVLYEELVGISATPILVDTLDPAVFIETVTRIAPTFGGIHLEDIRSPECFIIEDKLAALLHKPVLHDDQHGTATVALAAIINACRLTGIELRNARVGQVGLGAAGSAIAKLVHRYGVGEVIVSDLSTEAMERMRAHGMRPAPLEQVLREASIVIATTGQEGLFAPRMIQRGQVILALTNPAPEIEPALAIGAGAALAADGRSINNALAFPGLFKGALRARSRAIAPEMLIAAAEVIAAKARAGDLVPHVLDRAVHSAVEDAVAKKAEALGLMGTLRVDGPATGRKSERD